MLNRLRLNARELLFVKLGFHMVVSDGDFPASTGRDGDVSGTISKVEQISPFPISTGTSATPQKEIPIAS